MHYIVNLVSDADKLARCRTIIKEAYFDDELKPLIRYVLKYVDEERSVPLVSTIQAKTGHKITLIDDVESKRNRDWFMKDFEKFCRYRALENVILDGIDLQRKGESGEIERRVREAMTIRLSSDLGTAYFEDPAARLRRMLERAAIVSTGIKLLDEKLYGGFTRGELNLFLANSGVGKSLMLLNLALTWALAGYDVVYLSLELSEDMIALRVDAMLAGKGTKDVFKTIDDTALIIAMRGKRAGRLLIKKLPEAGTTTNHLRAYLTEYEIIHEKRPDGVLVDYLDLMYPNDGKLDVSQLHIKDKYVSEELRAFMHEYNVFGASASQLNRCVGLDTIVSDEQRGDIRVCDLKPGDRIAGTKGFTLVKYVMAPSRQKAYLIKTKSGKAIVCSGNHRFPTSHGLLSVDAGMVVGDVVTTFQCYSEIVEIVELPDTELMDIEVDGDHLFFANGILTHNSSIEAQGEFDQSHVAGGISKINTSDNVISMFAPPHLKERGEIVLTFLKTRNSASVGHKITIGYNPTTMRMGDHSGKVGADRPKTREELMAELRHHEKNEDIVAQTAQSTNNPDEAKTASNETKSTWSEKNSDLMNSSNISHALLEKMSERLKRSRTTLD